MTTLTTYHPANSWLHRARPGVKLLALVLAVTGILLSGTVALVVAELVVTAALYPLARVPSRLLWTHARPLLPFLVLIIGYQSFAAGWRTAVVVGGQLLVAVLLASLVTVTTRVSDMLALFERLARPLERVGVSARRIALVLALTIRCVPMVAAAWTASTDAYRARGLRRGGAWRVAVPVIVRLLRAADALGDAITARGIDVPRD